MSGSHTSNAKKRAMTTADETTDDLDELAQAAAALANDEVDVDHLVDLRRRFLAVAAATYRRREPREPPAAWSFRRAARKLGCGRDKLRALTRSGAIVTIPWGSSLRIPGVEIERFLAEGLDPPEPSPTPPSKRRRNGAAPRDEREAAVRRILEVED